MSKKWNIITKDFVKKKCAYCASKENLTIDHKVPLIQGGKDELKNFQCLCKRCNMIKSGLSNNQVKNLFRWFNNINADRVKNGKKSWGINLE